MVKKSRKSYITNKSKMALNPQFNAVLSKSFPFSYQINLSHIYGKKNRVKKEAKLTFYAQFNFRTKIHQISKILT
jgi:hypothetical protein